jgi:hypothetical protein
MVASFEPGGGKCLVAPCATSFVRATLLIAIIDVIEVGGR